MQNDTVSTKKVAIIGAGFAGLALAFDLAKNKNLQVEVIESMDRAGGMAAGYKEENWSWTLEDHYHHAFGTDKALQQFLTDLGLRDQLVYKYAKASTLYKGKFYQVDSALSLLRFKELSLWSRLRTGAVLAFLKLVPNGKWLENWRAAEWLPATMGQQAWKVLWQPLFVSKFGRFSHEVNMAWFWARVKPRTAALGYFVGGWQRLADLIVERLRTQGVAFHFDTQVQKIIKTKDQLHLSLQSRSKQSQLSVASTHLYDAVISTLPSPVFQRLIDLPEFHRELRGLGAMTMLLRLRRRLLPDDIYWLNVNEKNWPFVAIVEHSNYMSTDNYGGEHLVYLGRYLETSHPDFGKNAQQLLADYQPFLRKLQPDFAQQLIDIKLSKAEFAQPLSVVGQSRRNPPFVTSVPGLYWVSMQHVYPFDRGVNHAIGFARAMLKNVKIGASL